MAIDPLRSGFVQMCIDPSLNYFSPSARMLIEGALPTNPAAVGVQPAQSDVAILIPSAAQGIAACGTGVLGAAVAKAFCACPDNVDIWVLPRTADPTNVVSVYDMEFSGPATGPGTINIFLGDQNWVLSQQVFVGDTAATVANELLYQAQTLNSVYNFPYIVTLSASGNGLIFTSTDAGDVGNFLNPVWNYTGLTNIAPPGMAMTVTQKTVGKGSWQVDETAHSYGSILQECCYDVYALLTGDFVVQRALQTWLEAQWSCDTPQCFGHGYVWNNGTLGQVLATGSNAAVFNRLAYPVNDVNPPYLIVAEYAARSACIAQTNPEENIQGETYGLLSCIYRPSSCTQPWQLSERKQLSASGFVTWGPASMGGGYLTNPIIYEDITNYLYDALGRPNVTFRSTNMRRWSKAFAANVAQFLETTFDGLSFFESGTQIATGVKATTPALAYGKILDWLNSMAGVEISQITDPTKQVVLTSDMDVAPPCHGTPGKYYLRLIVGPPVRIAKFAIQLLPKLLDNCNRS